MQYRDIPLNECVTFLTLFSQDIMISRDIFAIPRNSMEFPHSTNSAPKSGRVCTTFHGDPCGTFLCDSRKISNFVDANMRFRIECFRTTEIWFWSSTPLQADHCQSNAIRDAHHQWNKLSLNLTVQAHTETTTWDQMAQTGISSNSSLKTVPLRLGFPCCFQLQIKLHWLKDTLATMTSATQHSVSQETQNRSSNIIKLCIIMYCIYIHTILGKKKNIHWRHFRIDPPPTRLHHRREISLHRWEQPELRQLNKSLNKIWKSFEKSPWIFL